MYIAIAVEPSKFINDKANYKVWYLQLNEAKDVVGMGAKSKEELVRSIIENTRRTGKSQWRAFKKGETFSHPIEVYDFLAMNQFENTHFGNLPTLSEFQETLDHLHVNFEIQAVA